MNRKTKLLLGVSGGPDSMALLYKYSKKNIVVAHVNYNVRSDSIIDENIVKNFCKENNIQFELCSLNKENVKGNFQNWARQKRYDFFQKVYEKYNCSKLLLAHHKDDFLETAELQFRSGRTPLYFGIKKKNFINKMDIKRPFLNKYWKNELEEFVMNNKIPHAIDSTNSQDLYARNAIRIEIAKWDQKDKKNRYKWYLMSNRILVKKTKKVNYLFNKWSKQKFSIKYFRNCIFKDELIFKFVHSHFENMNLTSNKISSIIDFILAERGDSKYIIADNIVIIKNKGRLECCKNKP